MSSTKLKRSTSSDQSTSEISRMLVMMLRTRDAAGHLPLVLGLHDAVGGQAQASQVFVDPGEGRGDAGVLIAQPLDQFARRRPR